MIFKEFFKTPQGLTGGMYALDSKYTEKEALELFEKECGQVFKEWQLKKDRVRFGFPPEDVEDRDDFDGPIWYTGAEGKGSREIWVIRTR